MKLTTETHSNRKITITIEEILAAVGLPEDTEIIVDDMLKSCRVNAEAIPHGLWGKPTYSLKSIDIRYTEHNEHG